MADETSTAQVPSRCSACDTPIPDGRTRCPACGKVFGEDNRCARCDAVAPVRMEGSQARCTACGAERERRAGTVVIESSGRKPELATYAARGGAVGLRLFGVAAIGGGVLAAALAAAVLPGAVGIVAAVVLGGLGVGLGALGLGAGSRVGRGAEEHARQRREQTIYELARTRQGVLTAPEVARELGVPVAQADEELTRLADGTHVTVEVTTDGRVEYEFRDWVVGPTAPRVRVESEPANDVPDAEGVASSEHASEDDGSRAAGRGSRAGER
jgi:hypothetical protein